MKKLITLVAVVLALSCNDHEPKDEGVSTNTAVDTTAKK